MRFVHARSQTVPTVVVWLVAVSVTLSSGARGDVVWRLAESSRATSPGNIAKFVLDAGKMEAALAQAPLQFSAAAAAAPATLAVPMPDGRVVEYRVESSPILQPGIAARYPGIRSYALREAGGRGHGRLTWTAAGAHALIATERGLVHVAPLALGGGMHESFFEAAFAQPAVQCQATSETAPALGSVTAASVTGPRSITAAVASGDTLRTYRLAVATTGEYYAGRGGNDVSVLASIVAEIDKVNVIYESEAAIQLVLIDDTDDLFFTDPTTDGYSNTVPCTMRVENQGIVDGILADDEYDIGMVFGTSGGGGCASQGVCVSGAKATGASGINVGLAVGHENFGGYRLVAHETGHQFSASHTWSGSQGNCTAGQFSASTAWEPGGGTTLMSYSGTCGSDNIQGVVEDTYMHTGTFDQVVAYTTTGNGNDCAQETATGNGAPSVDAGPDYTIPRQTPFVLSGDATDPDGDALTYTWEQLDVAAGQGPPNVDDGVGPLFRSFPPGPSAERTLPQLSDLIANTTTVGEFLPTVEGRILTFRLTARDNLAAGGGVDYDTAVLTVEGDPFVLLEPNGGETLHAGCSTDLTWEVGGGSIADEVDLLLSSDDGNTFTELLGGVANDGAQTADLPCEAAAEARAKAQAVGNIFFDMSDASFALVAEPPAVEAEATGGEVDEACMFTVPFEATIADDCAVGEQDVEVEAELLTGNATLGVPDVETVQVNASTVTVSGTVLVSDLTGSPATVRVTVTATDACGYQEDASADADVIDATPPSIEVELTPALLWPPNHRLENITATVVATDNCPGVSFALSSVSSDEPDDAQGGGDGHTTGDIRGLQLGTADLAFLLRAERQGAGDGRVYTATYVATDGSGNEAEDSAEVRVPHAASVFKP